MNYTCKFSVEKFWSPITHGGLEIKRQVKAEWSLVEKAKFLVLRAYVNDNYSFERSDTDDSKAILERIIDSIKDGEQDADDDELEDAEPILLDAVDDEMVAEDENI